MTNLLNTAGWHTLPESEMTPEELAAIRGRIADGIFLGGDYDAAYTQFLIAHRDRRALLAYADKLQAQLTQAIEDDRGVL